MELDSEDCLRQIMAIRGVVGASLVDYASGTMLGSSGREPSDEHEVTAHGVASVVSAALGSPAFTAAGSAATLDGIVLTAGNGYHLVHLIGARPDAVLVLYVWLDRLLGNLAMAQRRIHVLTEGLVAG
jgi:hypothetical protein